MFLSNMGAPRLMQKLRVSPLKHGSRPQTVATTSAEGGVGFERRDNLGHSSNKEWENYASSFQGQATRYYNGRVSSLG